VNAHLLHEVDVGVLVGLDAEAGQRQSRVDVPGTRCHRDGCTLADFDAKVHPLAKPAAHHLFGVVPA